MGTNQGCQMWMSRQNGSELTPNWKKSGTFSDQFSEHFGTLKDQFSVPFMYRKLILKSLRFVQFGDNLTTFVPDSDSRGGR